MKVGTYRERVAPLLPAVAQDQDEVVMDSNETFGQELREAVAKVLQVDPETLRPRQG